MIILTIILFFYLTVAILLFFNFILRDFNVTITTFSDNKKTTLEGFNKYKWCIILCLLWPIVIIKNLFE